jgi:hypothetical protein
MTTQLDGVVAEHVAAVNAFDEDAIVATFADVFAADAVVVDEGETRRGTGEIRAWQTGAASRYTYTTEVLSGEPREGDRYVVHGRLTGNFPGGTAGLNWDFTISSERINRLTIAPPDGDEPTGGELGS